MAEEDYEEDPADSQAEEETEVDPADSEDEAAGPTDVSIFSNLVIS